MLHARESFDDLRLPLRERAVVGDSSPAVPTPPGRPPATAVYFAQTIVADNYGGLSA
ncbi:hypothetical protein [Streptomyces sp. GZWMJZ-114]|uniref:hypothetical protein n=1 Tax=Streptomyces sp. GZWMJZ-114 TaxID=2494734 RepID=UPI0013E980FD|nr:hypothetical protein [Streptomyces sp. GZWMJZ-114]